MANPIHRIEPQLLTVPQFYGSAGEPTLGKLPNVQNPMMGQAQAPRMGGMVPLAALAAMMGQAQAPEMPQIPLSEIEETPNDEPLDEMPDYLVFKKAFAKARKMGLKLFNWRGNTYTTELKK